MADPVGLIYATARRHRRELLQNERGAASQMVRYYGQSWQRIQGQLADVQRRIAEAKVAGEDVSPSWLFQLGRLETLRAQVEAEIGRFAQYAENSIVAQQRQAVEAAQRHALDWTTTVPGVAVEWNRLPTGAMEDLVGFLSNRSPLRELLDELPQDAGQSVADALVTGLATGQNPRSTARLIRQALGGNLARALTISRTETLRAYREATRRSYLANRDVLRGWVWHSALDKRTCACCWAMHGTAHKLSENLDDHPNGRCAMVPLIKDWPNPDIEAGADVFARQPEEVQRSVLGDAGFEAYTAGAVSLRDYVGQTRSREWGTMRSARSLTSILGPTEAMRWRTAARAAAPTAHLPKPFDDDLVGRVEFVKDLGGSTGARLVRDPLTGRMYVMKRGASADHLREEVVADQLYRQLGVQVPECRLYDTVNGPVKLSEFIPDARTLAEVRSSDPALAARIEAQLRQGFAADAFLGNWDVIGLNADNILVDKQGNAWRVDNGGALRFRAQGAPKPAGWGNQPMELWTMRDPTKNSSTGSVYNGLGWYDLSGQMQALAAQRQALLQAVPADLRPIVEARLDWYERLSRTSLSMQSDRWVEAYVDELSRHRVSLEAAGVTTRLPTQLRPGGGQHAYNLTDTAGQAFDSLRGPGSVTAALHDYIRQNGGDTNVLDRWASDQAGSSWAGRTVGVKYWFATRREMTDSELRQRYYWGNSQGDTSAAQHSLQRLYNDHGRTQVDSAFTALHALNVEVLARVEMPGNDRAAGVLRLGRTESDSVMQRVFGVNASGRRKTAATVQGVRGALESGSLTNVVTVGGGNLTLQEVPHHRIMGMYLLSRNEHYASGMFLGDNENEVLFMGEGLDVHYVGKAQYGSLLEDFWRRVTR